MIYRRRKPTKDNMSKTFTFDEWWKNEWCKQIHQSLPTYDEVAQSAWNAAQQNEVQTRWVDCKERLPKGGMEKVYGASFTHLYYCNTNFTWFVVGTDIEVQPTHWLEILNLPPAPELPKVVDECMTAYEAHKFERGQVFKVRDFDDFQAGFFAGKAIGEKGGGK